jgi:tetraacyldisaccharide 4'-kinase
MRAPLRAQMRHAHALLILGKPSPRCDSVIAQAQARSLPILHGQLEAEADAVSALAGHRVLAFAGIGNPGKFFATLAEAGISVPVTRAFPDHHRYSRHEAEALVERAAREDLVLVTTEKDLVRIAHDPELATLAKLTRALPVTLQIEDEEPLRQLLFQKAP